MGTIGCVIVTYNKLVLLKECLEGIINQTHKVNEIFIIDNCSNDGTGEYINLLQKDVDNINYIKLENNIGGAGGFSYGIKKAYAAGMEYIWIMDDDTIPQPLTLRNLIVTANDKTLNWGFLSSNVRWIDNSACVMNVPKVSKDWNEKSDRGIIKIESASFVSLLINRKMLDEVGYPIKEYFIWGDDVEFTRRISQSSPGYFVPNSIVLHKMKNNKGINIISEDSNRLERYFYEYRNRVYTAREFGNKEFASIIVRTIGKVFQILLKKNKYKIKKTRIVLKGFFAGLVFHPAIETTRNSIKTNK